MQLQQNTTRPICLVFPGGLSKWKVCFRFPLKTLLANMAVVVKTFLGSHFGVGEFTTHFSTFFSWDRGWDCGYDLGHFCSGGSSCNPFCEKMGNPLKDFFSLQEGRANFSAEGKKTRFGSRNGAALQRYIETLRQSLDFRATWPTEPLEDHRRKSRMAGSWVKGKLGGLGGGKDTQMQQVNVLNLGFLFSSKNFSPPESMDFRLGLDHGGSPKVWNFGWAIHSGSEKPGGLGAGPGKDTGCNRSMC